MGTIIGSIYPVDNILIEENANNTFSNAVGKSFYNAVNLKQYETIFNKYGIRPFKDLDKMSLNELKSYRAILVKTRNKSDFAPDKNTISTLISYVDSLIKPLQKEKSETFWGGVWDKLVTASGVEPTTEEQTETIKVIDEEEDKPKPNYLLWGLGIGAGVIVIGGIIYLSLNKNK